MIKIFIGEVDYTNNISIAPSYIEKLDYELDIGTLTIPFSNKETPFPMYEKVFIYYDDVLIKPFLISTDVIELVSKNPLLYKHEISLIEMKKVLDTVIISGKSFTQPLVGVKKTMYDVIEDLRTTQPQSFDGDDDSLFTIPQPLIDYIDEIISKEYTFKETTLREAIDEVLSQIDAVCELNHDFSLGLRFFNETKALINGDYTNKIRKQDIQFYATTIEANALNPILDEDVTFRNIYYPAPNSYSTARSKEFLFNFDTAFFPTPDPIYDVSFINVVSNLKITINPAVDPAEDYFLTNFPVAIFRKRILEFQDYRRTMSANILELGTNQVVNSENVYQENTIFFNYGKKNIDISNTYGVFNTEIALINCILSSAIEQIAGTTVSGQTLPASWTFSGQVIDGTSYSISLTTGGFSTDFSNGLIPYNILYRPIPKAVWVSIEKQNVVDVFKRSSLIVNQQARILDLPSFKTNMMGRIKKIGNSELELTHRVKTLEYAFEIGDFTDGKFIISEREVILYKDFFYVKYLLSRDFNRLSENTAINSEIRQYEVSEADRTLERDVVFKEYVELHAGEENNPHTPTDKTIQTFGKNRFLSLFNQAPISSVWFGDFLGLKSRGTGLEHIFENYILGAWVNGSFRTDSVFESYETPETKRIGVNNSYTIEWGFGLTGDEVYPDVPKPTLIVSFFGFNGLFLGQKDFDWIDNDATGTQTDVVNITSEAWKNEVYYMSVSLDIKPTTPNTEKVPFAKVINDYYLYEEVTENILLPIKKHWGGNTISFSWAFEENVSAGDSLSRVGFSGTQFINQFVSYTEPDGTLEAFEIGLSHSQGLDTTFNSKKIEGRSLPVFGESLKEREFSFKIINRVKKDRREILKGTFVYQFIEKGDLIIGENFAKLNRNIADTFRDVFIVIYTTPYNQKNLFIAPEETVPVLKEPLDFTVDTANNQIVLNNDFINSSGVLSYAVVDENYNLYFAVNNARYKNKIWFDFRNKRSGVEYEF